MKTGSGTYFFMAVTAVVIFSTFEVVSKTMSFALSGTLLTIMRFFVGGLVLLPFAIRDMKKRGVHLTGRMLLLLFLFGFLLVFVSMTLAQYGIFLSSASLSAVIFSVNPLFVSLFAAAFLKEALPRQKLAGLLVGALGLVLSCIHALLSDQVSHTFLLGVVITIVAMLVFCIYSVFTKKTVNTWVGPTAATSLCSIFGAITLLPLVLVQGAVSGVNPFVFPILQVLPQFLYASIVGTGIAYLLYFTALANLNTSTGSMIFMIKPPLASIFAAVFLKEAITGNVIAGIILILAGMFLGAHIVVHRYQPA